MNLHETSAPPEMVEGYMDGFRDSEPEFPVRLSNRSACYRHGWLTGRDDRMRRPRASAAVLRREADLAEAQDQQWAQ